MFQGERDQLGQELTAMAILYGKSDFNKTAASQFIDALVKFLPATLPQYLGAVQAYAGDRGNRFFPTPIQLGQYLNNKPTKETLALEVAGRVRHAVAKFGYMGGVEAQAYIGDLGWAVVQKFGGWDYVCKNLGVELNPLTFQAQARELAKAQIELCEKGIYDQPIALPSANQQAQIINLEKIKQLPGLKSVDEKVAARSEHKASDANQR